METLTNFKFDTVALTEVIIISKFIKTISEMEVPILEFQICTMFLIISYGRILFQYYGILAEKSILLTFS